MRLARALAVALTVGMAMAWSPRYWSAAVAIGGICLVASAWAIVAHHLDSSPRLILLWAAVGLISAWGPLQLATRASVWPWLTLRASMGWLACGISFFLASQVAGGEKGRRIFLAWLLCGATILSLAAQFPVNPTIVGTFLYKNHFAAMVEMVAPIALCRAFTVPGNRLSSGTIFVALFAAMVASASRAGLALLLAELFVAIAVALSRRILRPKTALYLLAASVIVLGLAASIAGPDRIWEHFHEKNPWSIRQQLLVSTVRMVKRRPWFGYGLGTWRIVYPGFATFDTGLLANQAHNDWAEWAAEGGVPFSLLMAFLAVCLAKPSLQSIWGLGVLTAMLHSLIDYPIRDPATGLLWFALAGALSRFKETEQGISHSVAKRPDHPGIALMR